MLYFFTIRCALVFVRVFPPRCILQQYATYLRRLQCSSLHQDGVFKLWLQAAGECGPSNEEGLKYEAAYVSKSGTKYPQTFAAFIDAGHVLAHTLGGAFGDSVNELSNFFPQNSAMNRGNSYGLPLGEAEKNTTWRDLESCLLSCQR